MLSIGIVYILISANIVEVVMVL